MDILQTATDRTAELNAYRCWTWRSKHLCGCLRPADCILNDPLPVHAAPNPCPGQFGPLGALMPCCSSGSAA